MRDPQEWYDSAHRTIHRAATAARQPDGVAAPALDMAHAVVWDGTFGGRFADRDFARLNDAQAFAENLARH